MDDLYDQYSKGKVKQNVPVEYDQLCSPDLLNLLVDRIKDQLGKLGILVYSQAVPDAGSARRYSDTNNIEGLLNAAMAMLISSPEDYESWESSQLSTLHSYLRA